MNAPQVVVGLSFRQGLLEFGQGVVELALLGQGDGQVHSGPLELSVQLQGLVQVLLCLLVLAG